MDDFVAGNYSENVTWLTNPTPSGSYLGVLTLPKGKNSNETIDLLFEAPVEVRRTWRNQGEYERALPNGGTEIITRPRTELEKQDWDANERGKIDYERASVIPGNVSMSSAEDGENNPLGYYYFHQTPAGDPIQHEQYVFQPRAGLVKNIVNGEYIYTTGDELFNVDSDMYDIGMLITLNDPKYTAAKSFYAKQFKTNPNPIAPEGVPVTVDKAEARGIDVAGNQFTTTLRKGQIMLPENRVTASELQNYNNNNNWTFNSAYEGLNKVTSNILAYGSKGYDDAFGKVLTDKISSTFANTQVTYGDGSTKTFTDAINAGDLLLVPRRNVDGNFSMPIISGARTYEQQEKMYNEWVEGGKVGPPVANPAEGGFHVMGQAIDLSSNLNDYDWVLLSNPNNMSHGGVMNIGTNGASNQTLYSGYDQTAESKIGFNVADLVDASGGKVFPGFYKSSLMRLFDNISTTSQALKEHHKTFGAYREADTLPNLKQYDKEWWHWSLGELTNSASSGYIYPSWAN